MTDRAEDRTLVNSLVRRLRHGDAISEVEADALAGLIEEVRSYPAQADVCRKGEPLAESKLLIEGFVGRTCRLADGRRQILAIHVPGDYVDLHAFVLKSLDHDIVALSHARLAATPHDRLTALVKEQSHLTRMLWFATAVDASIHREWLASFGRNAAGRIAHLFCELRERLEAVGMADASGYGLPLTQIDIADATSLTPVHVNRTLRQLREQGLVDFRHGRVEIGDLGELIRLSQFDPHYLYLDRTPR